MQKSLRFFPEVLLLALVAVFIHGYVLKEKESGIISAKQLYGTEYRYEIQAKAPFRLVALSKSDYSIGKSVAFIKQTHVVVTILDLPFYLSTIGNYLIFCAVLLFVASGIPLVLFLRRNRLSPDPMALVFTAPVKRRMRQIILTGLASMILVWALVYTLSQFGIAVPKEAMSLPGDSIFAISFFAFYKYMIQLHQK